MLENLKKNEERKGFIDFKINSPKHDGAYFTKIFTENKIINQKTFGYYSNGIPSGSTYYIQILADSLIVNEYFDK
ncbi:hypothetical protein [uncultured Winogradskyella sp.]|uniref:hypothetical protein n=1 Tax=uncultured Winogradskyella sp. TaxID=395353 RepID=UPI00263515A8|nr:hypothetical protein [uncultured Winogradskyella sp.]